MNMKQKKPQKVNQILRMVSDHVTGIYHIGANRGGEYSRYNCFGFDVIWFEPIEEVANQLIQSLKENNINNQKVHICALGSKEGVSELHIASNNGASSSLLKPLLHLKQHKHVTFEEQTRTVPVRTLDQFTQTGFNTLVIDVQGFELEVLKGGVDALKNVDFLIAEVNFNEVYKNCVHYSELRRWLEKQGFELIFIERLKSTGQSNAVFGKPKVTDEWLS